jgi:hypothetical protein
MLAIFEMNVGHAIRGACGEAAPLVDYDGGCSWSRMDWPKGFATVKNSLSWEGNLLATERAGGI